jgi:hypothetical protein
MSFLDCQLPARRAASKIRSNFFLTRASLVSDKVKDQQMRKLDRSLPMKAVTIELLAA